VRDIQLLATDGAIIVVEIANKITEELNTQEYFRKLYNRIEVSFLEHFCIKSNFNILDFMYQN